LDYSITQFIGTETRGDHTATL